MVPLLDPVQGDPTPSATLPTSLLQDYSWAQTSFSMTPAVKISTPLLFYNATICWLFMFVDFGHPPPERSHSLLASTKCQRHMRWAPAKATPKRVTLTCGWWKRSTSFQSAVSGEMTSRTETPVVFTDLWLDSVCVCACGHVCACVCVCKYIVYVCVWPAIHTYEDTKDSAHMQEASSEESTHNGYRISLYTVAA